MVTLVFRLDVVIGCTQGNFWRVRSSVYINGGCELICLRHVFYCVVVATPLGVIVILLYDQLSYRIRLKNIILTLLPLPAAFPRLSGSCFHSYWRLCV